MKLKLPKTSMPNLKLPKTSDSTKNLTSLFKSEGGGGFNTSGIIDQAKSKVPSSIKKFIPNLKSGGAKNINPEKIIGKSTFDVDGMMSKSMNMTDVTKNLGSSDLSFDVNLPAGAEGIGDTLSIIGLA